MNTRTPLIASVLLAASLLSGVAHAALPSYTFTDLGRGAAYAINASGQVVGFSVATNGANHATLWNGTTATDLGRGVAYAINDSGQAAGTTVGYATLWNGSIATNIGNFAPLAINASGQVAGYYYYDGANRATLWNGTTAIDLLPLGWNGAGTRPFDDRIAFAINASGQVVGFSKTADGAQHATLWNGTTAIDLGTLEGAYSSQARAINDSGQVAGFSHAGGVSRATLWNGTTAIDLGVPEGSYFSEARAINASGQVAGFSAAANGANHATLWNGTTAIDLNTLLDASTVHAGWVLQVANGINDNGWIVGYASNSILGISQSAFLLSVTSVPEPETYGMMLAGLGLVGVAAQRRKLAKV